MLAIDRGLGALENMVIAALVVVITVVTFAQVVSRYVFSDSILWSEEVARYLFVWITLVGGIRSAKAAARPGSRPTTRTSARGRTWLRQRSWNRACTPAPKQATTRESGRAR